MTRGVDYIGVGVGAIIIREDGSLFLARRGPSAKNERGLWEFPGGAVEFGETLVSALRREMIEEFNIEIEVISLLDVVDHILPLENQHWVSPTYICRLLSGEPEIQEKNKCSEIGWFQAKDFPEMDELSVISRENYKNLLETRKDILRS
jgi:8-oxo-dGTP diphosphatase